jgi:hypothetical protein
MSSYTRCITASDLSKLSFAIKSADDDVRADYDAKKMPEHSSEKDTGIATGLTLDDFGGRSDALGG